MDIKCWRCSDTQRWALVAIRENIVAAPGNRSLTIFPSAQRSHHLAASFHRNEASCDKKCSIWWVPEMKIALCTYELAPPKILMGSISVAAQLPKLCGLIFRGWSWKALLEAIMALEAIMGHLTSNSGMRKAALASLSLCDSITVCIAIALRYYHTLPLYCFVIVSHLASLPLCDSITPCLSTALW